MRRPPGGRGDVDRRARREKMMRGLEMSRRRTGTNQMTMQRAVRATIGGTSGERSKGETSADSANSCASSWTRKSRERSDP